jgi:hypothetical protein
MDWIDNLIYHRNKGAYADKVIQCISKKNKIGLLFQSNFVCKLHNGPI